MNSDALLKYSSVFDSLELKTPLMNFYLGKGKLKHNRFKTNITTVEISSANRDKTIYPNSNNYKIKLGRIYKNVKKITIKSLEFINNQKLIKSTPVSSKNNNIYWTLLLGLDDISVPTSFFFQASIRPGTYTDVELAEEIQYQMNKEGGFLNIRGIYPDFIIRYEVSVLNGKTEISAYMGSYSNVDFGSNGEVAGAFYCYEMISDMSKATYGVIHGDVYRLFDHPTELFTSSSFVANKDLEFEMNADSVVNEYNLYEVEYPNALNALSYTYHDSKIPKILTPIKIKLLSSFGSNISPLLGLGTDDTDFKYRLTNATSVISMPFNYFGIYKTSLKFYFVFIHDGSIDNFNSGDSVYSEEDPFDMLDDDGNVTVSIQIGKYTSGLMASELTSDMKADMATQLDSFYTMLGTLTASTPDLVYNGIAHATSTAFTVNHIDEMKSRIANGQCSLVEIPLTSSYANNDTNLFNAAYFSTAKNVYTETVSTPVDLTNEEYIFMTSEKIGGNLIGRNVEDIFAKIQFRDSQTSSTLYNTFVSQSKIWELYPLNSLHEIDFAFRDRNNNLFDFYNVDHTFTLEIIEYLDILDSSHISSVRGIIDEST
jgi:hypothetical protein